VAVDQLNVELKKMSDSTMSPVMMSTTKPVAPRTRSSSGSSTKPRTDRSSSSNGSDRVNPPN